MREAAAQDRTVRYFCALCGGEIASSAALGDGACVVDLAPRCARCDARRAPAPAREETATC